MMSYLEDSQRRELVKQMAFHAGGCVAGQEDYGITPTDDQDHTEVVRIPDRRGPLGGSIRGGNR